MMWLSGLTGKVKVLTADINVIAAHSANKWAATGAYVNDIARQLRAQIAFSTDPDRLERMARAVESQASSVATTSSDKGIDSREGTALLGPKGAFHVDI
jgi:hypothetical protein